MTADAVDSDDLEPLQHHGIVAVQLDDRAKWLKYQAWAFLVVVVVLIGFGYRLYTSAQEQASSDISGNVDQRISDFSNKINTLTDTLQKDGEQRTPLEGIVDQTDLSAKGIAGEFRKLSARADLKDRDIRIYYNLAGKKTALALYYGDISAFADQVELLKYEVDFDKINKLSKEISSTSQSLEYYQRVRELLEQRKAQADAFGPQQGGVGVSAGSNQMGEQNIDLIRLIQTNILRFGSLAIILFIVTLFISLYRFNTRLACFYLARSDALRLSNSARSTKTFISLSSAMTPNFDFGKAPATPMEQLLQLLRAAKAIKFDKED